MAQFYTDFSGDTVGQPPAGWTDAWTAYDVFEVQASATPSGKVLRCELTTNPDRMAIWDAIPNTADVEILIRQRGSAQFGAAARVDPNAALEEAYRAGFQSNNGGGLFVTSYNPTFTLASIINNQVPGNWHWVRFRLSGSAVKARMWDDAISEPSVWGVEVTDTSHVTGLVGFLMTNRNQWAEIDVFSVGTGGDAAPTTPPSGGDSGGVESGALSTDGWMAQVAAESQLTSAGVAADQFGGVAAVNLAIVEAAQANDATGDSPAAPMRLSASATGNATVDALTNAAVAISAGAVAGEGWAAQAQVVVELLEQGAAADRVRRQTDSAVNAAIASGSAAAVQFVAAIESVSSLTGSATLNDAYLAIVAQLGSIASGAIADDTFRTSLGLRRTLSDSGLAGDSFGVNFGYLNAIRSGALTSDAWGLMVTISAALAGVCTASDLLNSRATVSAAVRAGAVATDQFSLVNAGIRSLVMGAIILRDALNARVNTKPALNQSVKIKPGH